MAKRTYFAKQQPILPTARALRRPRWLAPLLLLFYLYLVNQYPHWKDTNACSRVYQTLAIVDDGGFAIDNCLAQYGNTQDKAQFEGRFYSDKPPGVAFWLSPWARALRWFIPAGELHFERTYYWLRVLGLSIPAALFWWAVWPQFAVWSGSPRVGVSVVLVGSLGTGWLAYSTALYSHVPAGVLLFLSFLSLRTAHALTDSKRSRTWALLAGLLGGAALICDFVVAVAVPILGLWSLLGGARRWNASTAGCWLAGLAPPLAAWMLYNVACFGGPLSVGFLAHSDAGFSQAYQSGWLGIQPPDLAAVPGLLFSPARGLFFVSPALLLGPWGLLLTVRRQSNQGVDAQYTVTRTEAAVCVGVVVAVLAFATTTVDWRAGWAYGPRYLVPVVPFLLVGVAAAIREQSPARNVSTYFAAAGVIGVGWSVLAMLTTPLWVQEFRNPGVWFSGATLVQGHVARTLASDWIDVWSALPVILAAGFVMAWLVAAAIVEVASASVTPVGQLLRVGITVTFVLAAQLSVPEWPAAKRAQQIQRAELLIRLGYLDAAKEALGQLDAHDPPRTAVQSVAGDGKQAAP